MKNLMEFTDKILNNYSGLMFIIFLYLLFVFIKFILRKIIIKTKYAYCSSCKFSLPFIYSVCQEDCYHPKNLIIENDTAFKKEYRTKYLDEDGTDNSEHNCKYFKLGFLYKLWLILKIGS